MPSNHGAPLSPNRSLGDKLHQLARLAPDDVAAIEVLVDAALARRLAERTASFLHLVQPSTHPKT